MRHDLLRSRREEEQLYRSDGRRQTRTRHGGRQVTIQSKPSKNGSAKTSGGGFNVSAWAIQHPWMIASFYVAIVILAAVSIFGGIMPRRMMPYVESPMVGIVTMMPGLSAQEMETYISKPIEERMTDIR